MISEIEEVCRQVLKKAVPSKSERRIIQKITNDVRDRIALEVDKVGIKAEIIIGGSVAKDTWLNNEADIDIFILFPPTLNKQRLGEVGLEVAKNAMHEWPRRERYAEHPYLEVFVNGIRVNVVPCFQVDRGRWLSAADRTPFHTKYVIDRLNQLDLKNDIRLLKGFSKGIGVYGAEIRVGGFSGYLCELLIINYQSFQKTLKSISNWKIGEVIDIENQFKGRIDEARRFFDAPLIVIDPVDENRNVAAAVSEERLGELITTSRFFLEKPGLSFFYPREINPPKAPMLKEVLSQLGFDLIFLAFQSKETVPDILWGQLYKSMRAIKRLLVQNDFYILKASAWSDEKQSNILVFALENHMISFSKRHVGPLIDSKEAVNFLEKHLSNESTTVEPWIEGMRWMVGVKRRHRSVVFLLQEKLKDGGRGIGVARKFTEEIRNSYKILINEEILDLYISNQSFAMFLTDFIKLKPNWLQ